MRAGKLLHAYEGPITHRGAVLSIDFDPTEPNTFATGGADGILRFWSSDLPFSCKGISASDSSAVRSVNFLPDGGAVLAGTNNHLRSWAIPHKMGAAAAPAPPTAGRAAGLPYASTLDMLDIPWASLQCCWLGQNIRRGSAAAGTGGKGALHLMGASIAGSVVSIWGADLTQMAPLADKPLHAFSVLAAGSGAGAASAAAGGSNSSGIAAAAVAGGKQSQPATVSIDLQAPTPQFAAGSGGAAAAGGSTAAGAGATAFAGGAAVQLQPAPAGRRSQAGSAAAGGASESKLDMQQSPLKLPVSTSSSSSSSAPATAPAPGVAAAPPAVDIEEEFMAMLSGQVDIFPHSSTAGKDASSSRKQQAAAVSRHSSGGKNTGAHLPSSSLPSSRAASSRSSGTVAPVEDTSLQEGEDSSSWGAGGEGSDPFAKRDKLLREKGAAASASTAAGAAAAVSASLTAVHSSAFAEEVPEEEEEQEDSEAGEDGEEEEEQGQGDTSILARTLASIDISAAASSSSAAAMGGAPPPHTADVRRGKGQSSERKIAEEEVDDEEALESHSYPSILGGSGPLSSAAQSFTAGSGKSQQEIAAALKAYGSRYGGVGGGAAASQDEGKAAETPTSGREAGSKGRSTASSSTSGHRAAGSQDSADSKSSYSEDEFVSEEEDVKGLEEEKQRRRQKQTGAQTQTQTPSTLASPAGKHAGASALFSPLSPVDGSPRAEPSSERAAAGLGTASPLSTSNGLRQFNLQLAKQAQQEQQQQQAMPGVSSSSTASTAAPTAASTATAAAHSSADGSSRTKSPERKAEHKPSASSKSSKAGASSSSGSGSGSGRKAALVPSQRDRPLGLDFNEFLPHSSSAGASGAAGGGARLGQGLGATGLLSLSKGGVAFSSSSPGGMSLRGTLRRQQQLELEEVRTAARLLQGHENFCSGLASRAEEEAAAGELWRRGQINGECQRVRGSTQVWQRESVEILERHPGIPSLPSLPLFLSLPSSPADAISAIAASSAEDAVVAADFLRNHRLQSGVLGLEAAALLLPCCSYLLQSMQAE